MGWCNTTSRVAPTALFRQGFTEASSLALPGKTWKKKDHLYSVVFTDFAVILLCHSLSVTIGG